MPTPLWPEKTVSRPRSHSRKPGMPTPLTMLVTAEAQTSWRDPRLRWGEVSSEIEVIVVSGSHFTAMSEPHVAGVAALHEALKKQRSLTGLGSYRVADIRLQIKRAVHGQRSFRTRDDIRLLFTDVGLPGINGRVLAKEAQHRLPGLKVVFTTGYARNAIVHGGLLDPGVELLPKPFTIDSLARKLALVHSQKLAGAAAWRLGFEDGSFWSILG